MSNQPIDTLPHNNTPSGKKYDFLEAKISLNLRGFIISWVAKGMGFGHVSFDVGPEGQVHIDTEYMSDLFVKELMEYAISKATKDAEPAPFKTSNQIFFEGHDSAPDSVNPYESGHEKTIWQQGYNIGHKL